MHIISIERVCIESDEFNNKKASLVHRLSFYTILIGNRNLNDYYSPQNIIKKNINTGNL